VKKSDTRKKLASGITPPDGSREGRERFIADINDRISSDMRNMGYAPKQTEADPRAKYVGNNQDIFRGANSTFANTGDEAPKKPTTQAAAPKQLSMRDDYAAYRSPPGKAADPVPKPRLRPENLPVKVKAAAPKAVKTKTSGKTDTRLAFEKEYARAKANKQRVFTFKGKQYKTS
jgi:hypothetical protein